MNFRAAKEKAARHVARRAWRAATVTASLGALLTVASFVNKGVGVGTIVLGAATCYLVAGACVGLLIGTVLGRGSTLSLAELEEWGIREIASVHAIEREAGLYKLRCPACGALCDAVELHDLEREVDCECACGFCFEVSGGDPAPADTQEGDDAHG